MCCKTNIVGISKKLSLSFILMVMVFLLTWCGSKSSQDTIVENTKVAQVEEIQAELQEKIDILEEQKTELSFPSWLSELNIFEPENMELAEVSSYQTTEEVEWFNSIHFVYNWAYDYAMDQAEKIATTANIPVSAEFKMAQDMLKNMDSDNIEMQKAMLELAWDMKWIVYTNYSLLDASDIDYTIAITVNEDGSLEIDVTDMIAMKKIEEEFTK